MSKKARQKSKQSEPSAKSRPRQITIVIVGLILCLSLSSVLLAQWRAGQVASRPNATLSSAPLAPVPPPSLAPSNPSKEYIYAGGKLVATEEPAPALPVNAATFVSQTVPSSMIPGQAYSVTVTMKNTGTSSWTAAGSYRLGAQNPQDNTLWRQNNRVELSSDVVPGAEATFTFTVTAPAATGTYNFQWGMVQDGVQWFGDFAPSVVVSVASSDQSITFDPLPDRTYGDAPFPLSATSSSGLQVSYMVSGPASLSGNVVTITGAGTVTVQADQAGGSGFNPAPPVTRSFTVAKAAATVSLSNLSQTYDGSGKAVTATTTPAGLSGVSITYNGSTQSPVNAGTYDVMATVNDANYQGTGTGTLVIAKATQSISFAALPDKTYGDAPFTVSATGGASGNSVTFSSQTPATCSVSGNTVSITAAGSCTVRASQTGNSNYNAATDVDRPFTVAKAASTSTITISNTTYDGNPHGGTATVTGAGGLSQSLTITYTGRNGTVYSSTTAPSNAGDYTASVSFDGDANHNSSNDSKDFSITKAGQTIMFAQPADKTYGDADFTANASASSGLGVNLAAVGQCTVGGSTVHITGAGTCTLTASQGGGTNYNAATNVVRSFAIAKADSTISVTAADATYDGQPHGGSAVATGAGGLNLGLAVTYTGRNGTSYGPSATAPTNIGDYTVSAIFGGDANHTGSSGSKDFRILKAGSLSGRLAAQTVAVNLSTEGTADWAHWGRGGAPGFDHKAGVTQQISDITVLGNSMPVSYGDLAYTHTWADGTPTTSATATTGVRLNTGGFQITVPADTSVRTLKLYVGVLYAQGQLQAQLSDGSAPVYTDASVLSSSGTKNFVYTISYNASSAGQTLTISYTNQGSLNPDGSGYVTLQAATLMLGTPPPLPANGAEFISQTVPTTMTSGQTYSVSVKMLNTGANTWTAAGHYNLGSQNPQDTSTWGSTRVAPVSAVITGDQITFTFNVTAPQTASATTYNFQWRMIQDGVEWFGAYTPNVTVTVSPPVVGGSLSGSGASQTANVNLSIQGTADWAHWGRAGTTGFNHKAGVTQQISNYTVLGTSAVMSYGALPYAFSWTGGTPTTSATTSQYVAATTLAGNGFRITVPADTSTRTLKLYVGATFAKGQLTAQLSDSSAPVYTDATIATSPSGTKNFVYTINYSASSSGQTLTITYTILNAYNGSSSNVGLQAATLIVASPQASLPGYSEGTPDLAQLGSVPDAPFDHEAGAARRTGDYPVPALAAPVLFAGLVKRIVLDLSGYGGTGLAAAVSFGDGPPPGVNVPRPLVAIIEAANPSEGFCFTGREQLSAKL